VFNPNSDIPIEEARKKASVFEQEVAEIESSIESVKGIIAKYRSKKSEQESELKAFISKMKENSLNVSKIEDQIASTEREIARGENDVKRKLADVEAERDMISDDRDRMSSYESQIEEVKKEQPDTSRINNLRKLVKEHESKIKDIEKDLEAAREIYDNHSIWKQRFLQFKSYLANKKLRIIQDRINMRLGEMKCDYRLRLEGYKVLSSGEIREKITPYIYKDGEVCDYGEFSKGERARIDFATMITLQTLINDTCENGGLDLLMCDEVMEGLDSQGLNAVLNSFNSMNKTSFVTTHVVNDNLYEHTKMVVKINGKSKIQESWEKN